MAERHHVVEIAGEEYRLRYEIQALLDAKKVSGQTAGQLLAAVTQLDVNAMATLLWAGLQRTRHGFKLADAPDLLQKWVDEGADLEDIGAALMQTAYSSGLIRKSEPEGESPAKEGDDGEGPKAG